MIRLIAYALAGAVLLPIGVTVFAAAFIAITVAALALVEALAGPLGDTGTAGAIIATWLAVCGALAGAGKAALD